MTTPRPDESGDSAQRESADQALARALEERGARDPREFYRERLRELKQRDSSAYQTAVAYFAETLIPSVARGEADPLQAWTEYGMRLAELSAPGSPVEIDGSGRASPCGDPADLDALILHVPEARNVRPLVVGLPPQLTAAQRATYDWLVGGRLKLRE